MPRAARWLAMPLVMAGAALSPAAPNVAAGEMQMDDAARFGRILVDQLEWRDGDGAPGGVWEAEGWYGNDDDKLLLRSEGDWPAGAAANAAANAPANGRAELLWDRIFTRWWSVQGGARGDFGAGPGRGWAALGVQGLAPYWIDVQATAYLGSAGTLAARLKTETDLRFTQRLILQPELELNAYSRPDRARDQSAGLADLQAGLRLRYELRRELAPYLGVVWLRREGEPSAEWQWLAGVRFWL
jgi:copper resistance protein B